MQIQRPTGPISAAAPKPPAIAEVTQEAAGDTLQAAVKAAAPTLLGDNRLAEGLGRIGAEAAEAAQDLPWDAKRPTPAEWEDDPTPDTDASTLDEQIVRCHGNVLQTAGGGGALRPRPRLTLD